MDTESLRRLQVIQLDRERGELHEKLRQTGKRIDHYERALRREEIPYLNADYDRQLADEARIFEAARQKKLALARQRHLESVELKKRLARVLPDYKAYRDTIKEKRSEEFQQREREARAALEAEKAKRIAAHKKRLEDERREREEREAAEQRERERIQREEEEAQAKVEALRKAAEEKKRQREDEQRYQNFIAILTIQKTGRNRRKTTTARARSGRKTSQAKTRSAQCSCCFSGLVITDSIAWS